MRVLLASGFFESELPSFREYSYAKELAALGHDVALMCGDQSYVWSRSRIKLPITDPARFDATFVASTGVRLLRQKIWFRVSDFVLYRPLLREIRRADVVHVIEFRQGVTLLVAWLARACGKRVVYDHEQRGDRSDRWYSRLDSLFRRMLVFLGSYSIACMRHTVLANRDHFRSCTPRRVEEMFAPLGVDPQRFYYDELERDHERLRLGLAPDARVAIMSGKLHRLKRVADVVTAARRAGMTLILVGTLDADSSARIAAMGEGGEIILPQAGPEQLRRLYNAADAAVFTTFSVSYWEAHATGLQLFVPAGPFAQLVFEGDPGVTQFGDAGMFRVPDEVYRADFDLVVALTGALSVFRRGQRRSRTRYSSAVQARELAALYINVVNGRKLRPA